MLWQPEPAPAVQHHLYTSYLGAWWPMPLQRRRDRYLAPRVALGYLVQPKQLLPGTWWAFLVTNADIWKERIP